MIFPNHYKLFFSRSLTLFTFILLALGCRYISSSPHKSDSQMISNFQKNKEKFTRLIEMAKEDKNIVIANSSKKNDSGLPNERYEDYKKLLQETEIRVISSYGTNSSNQKKEISLISTFDSDGLLDACFYEEEKGYKWMGNPPQDGKIVENLYWEYAQGSDVCAYRQIEDNWNLYYFHQKCAN